jgi:hypothetical protein
MKRYQEEDIEKAKKLRKKFRYSFAQLQKITGIPATTIRNWCKNDYLGTKWDTLLITNQRKRKELKMSEIGSLHSLQNIDAINAKIFASLLYWCEGTKYPISNKIEFTNSDPQLQTFFVMLLRKAFSLDESKFRVHLQIHNTHDYEKIKNYWSKLLNIPKLKFIKPTITNMKGKKHRKDYLGTCTVRYNDFRVKLKLIGIHEELARRFGEVT